MNAAILQAVSHNPTTSSVILCAAFKITHNSRCKTVPKFNSLWNSSSSSEKRNRSVELRIVQRRGVMDSLLGTFGLLRKKSGTSMRALNTEEGSSIAQGPDDDVPAAGQQFAQFGAGCFWGVELAFQRVPGVTKTEVGYSQGVLHNPSYEDVCTGGTMHSEIVRVQYDPNQCSYDALLSAFWARHDPTTLNRQGNDAGTQYRSGIYYYTPDQEKAARESMERQQKLLNKRIVTEILPAKKFYRAEEYHQQYLEKGGRFGSRQSAAKGCTDSIRCYG